VVLCRQQEWHGGRQALPPRQANRRGGSRLGSGAQQVVQGWHTAVRQAGKVVAIPQAVAGKMAAG